MEASNTSLLDENASYRLLLMMSGMIFSNVGCSCSVGGRTIVHYLGQVHNLLLKTGLLDNPIREFSLA